MNDNNLPQPPLPPEGQPTPPPEVQTPLPPQGEPTPPQMPTPPQGQPPFIPQAPGYNTTTPNSSGNNKQKKLIKQAQAELHKSNNSLKTYTNEITSSIRYAKNIQNAILPKDEIIKEVFHESFI